MKSTLQVAQIVACPPGYDNSKPYFIAETTYTIDGPRTRIADGRFATEAQARAHVLGKQPYAPATDRIDVGDRVQHLNGRTGVVRDLYQRTHGEEWRAHVELDSGGQDQFWLKHLTKLQPPQPANAHADYEAPPAEDTTKAPWAATVVQAKRDARLLNILDNMRGGVIDNEEAVKCIKELFDKPWNTVLEPAPTVANTTPVLGSEPVLHVQRHKLEGRFWLCGPNEPEDGVWSAAIPLFEKEEVTINVGDLTMERVFRRPGMDPLHNLANLQEVFNRIEMALEAQGRTE